MSQLNENSDIIKTPIDKRTKISVLKQYEKLKSINPPMHLKDIISEITETFGISKSSFWRIKASGAVNPNKPGPKNSKFNYCDNDYELTI